MFKIKRLNHLWFQSLLLNFLKFAGQVRLQFAPRCWLPDESRLTASSWWWIAVTKLFPFLQTFLLSLMPLIKGSLGFFFLWHFGSHWVWRDLLPPHFLDALGAAWRALNCSGMLLKKQVVSPALLFWPLHSSLAAFIFGPPHVRWHWLDPKCYTSKQGGYAAPESPSLFPCATAASTHTALRVSVHKTLLSFGPLFSGKNNKTLKNTGSIIEDNWPSAVEQNV